MFKKIASMVAVIALLAAVTLTAGAAQVGTANAYYYDNNYVNYYTDYPGYGDYNGYNNYNSYTGHTNYVAYDAPYNDYHTQIDYNTYDSVYQNHPTISITHYALTPSTVYIQRGDTVVWANNDDATHSVVSDTFNSGSLFPGRIFSQVFEHAGTYYYHCSIHSSMNGKVVVGNGISDTYTEPAVYYQPTYPVYQPVVTPVYQPVVAPVYYPEYEPHYNYNSQYFHSAMNEYDQYVQAHSWPTVGPYVNSIYDYRLSNYNYQPFYGTSGYVGYNGWNNNSASYPYYQNW
ncbi:MAG: cupredoxin domain-containing protein [Candidatus Gracilibacteria bacterium]